MQSGCYRRYARAEPIFLPGAQVSAFFVVLSGRVGLHDAEHLPPVHQPTVGAAYAELPAGAGAAGSTTLHRAGSGGQHAVFVTAGERFGEVDLVTSAMKRDGGAFAYEATELLELPRSAYYRCARCSLQPPQHPSVMGHHQTRLQCTRHALCQA